MAKCGLGLENHRVLVTASTRGLGFGIAKVLALCGASIVVNGRRQESVRVAVERLRGTGTGDVWGVRADMAVPGEPQRLVRAAVNVMNGLDAVVYVPPPVPRGKFGNIGSEDWRLSYRLLIEAAIEIINEALNVLIRSKNPSITFVTSIAAWEPIENIATSSVLRPGLHSLTVLLARQLGRKGIRVNSVVPGYFMTDRLKSILESRATAKGTSIEEELRGIESSIPLGRVGEPEELGWAVAFLVSPRASYVSGALLPVTGGLHRHVR